MRPHYRDIASYIPAPHVRKFGLYVDEGEHMKEFTEKDLQPHAGHMGLWASREELIDAPLWWQERGLQQTASGYGSKLTSSYKIRFGGRDYRLYVTCYSNAGSTWFTVKGRKIFIIG